jgi:hypothetical protein
MFGSGQDCTLLKSDHGTLYIGELPEIESTKQGHVFLKHENIGIVPAYVLQIVPKRSDKYLLRGQIWVDGVLAENPSIWLGHIHITLQFAQLKGMWIPNSFDAIATVRLLGQYTLAGHNT